MGSGGDGSTDSSDGSTGSGGGGTGSVGADSQLQALVLQNLVLVQIQHLILVHLNQSSHYRH